jgi:SAM-dependent methyltransferase
VSGTYLDDQRLAFREQVARGVYSASHYARGANREFFLRVVRTALGARWSSTEELRILECGVGDGRWLDAIRADRQTGISEVSGFDVTEEMTAVAAGRFPAAPDSPVRPGFFRVGDITSLDAYRPASETGEGQWYDLVFCYDVIQQLPESMRVPAIELMLKATKREGATVIFDKQRLSRHGITMAIRKWLTAHRIRACVPQFYLLARYPNMSRVARLIRRTWGRSARLIADDRREHFALILQDGERGR